MTLDLNAVMSIIANGPAVTASTVSDTCQPFIYRSSLILHLLDRSLPCRSPLSQFLSKRGDVLVGPFIVHCFSHRSIGPQVTGQRLIWPCVWPATNFFEATRGVARSGRFLRFYRRTTNMLVPLPRWIHSRSRSPRPMT